jgi:hypothetical protein
VWRGIKSDVDEYPTVPTIRHYRWFGRFRGQLSTEDAPGQDSLPTTPILPGIGTVHIRISSRPSP